jgi:hypothetical protein
MKWVVVKKLFVLKCYVFFILFFFGCSSALYQNEYEERRSFWYVVGDIIVPEIIMNTYKTRDFISSDYFFKFKNNNGDMKAIDEIYNYAFWLTDGDIPQTLFIVTFSTLPYKNTPAKLPLINLDIMFYFSLESDSNFKKRYNNLPSHFLSDSPENSFGDKDKLPHYFGSAYLSYITNLKIVPKYVGYMIEFGEAFFNLDGYCDERDVKVNLMGASYGLALLLNYKCMPSEYIKDIE